MSRLIVPFQCKGRNHLGKSALEIPVSSEVVITPIKGDTLTISLNVNCTFNTGSHGQRCKASHPDQDNFGVDILCPYSLDIPYVEDNKE